MSKCPYVIKKLDLGSQQRLAPAALFECRITGAQCVTPEQYEDCIHWKIAWKDQRHVNKELKK